MTTGSDSLESAGKSLNSEPACRKKHERLYTFLSRRQDSGETQRGICSVHGVALSSWHDILV
jgi:hypothetical protein